MIPGFTDDGYLPPGIHQATLEEIEQRFGSGSEIREVQFESIRWLVELARGAGVRRMILNGSFVADVSEPNDVDCLLLIDKDFPKDAQAEAELRQGLPFLDMELADQPTFDFYVDILWSTDRSNVPKGMVEVIL